jgi:hypothetical protein
MSQFQTVSRFVSALAVTGALLFAACNNNDDNGDVTPSPTPTQSQEQSTPSPETETPTPTVPVEDTPTPTPEPDPDTGNDPDPNEPSNGDGDGVVVAPTLPDGVTEVTIGTLQLQLHPGAIAEVDPVHVAVADVGQAPPCAGLAATWTWSSSPTGAGSGLTVDAIRQGGGEQVGSGPTGEADTGCMLLRFRNGGDEQVTVTVNYAIGEFGS